MAERPVRPSAATVRRAPAGEAMVKRSDLSNAPPWVSLEEICKRLSASLGDNARLILETIIGRGRISVLATRSDVPDLLPNQVQDLLSKACRISVDAPRNLITGVLQFASVEDGHQVLGARSTWIWFELGTAGLVEPILPSMKIRPMACLQFDQVRVCWSDVVRELRGLELWCSDETGIKGVMEVTNTLSPASRHEIDRAIGAAYDLAEANGQKPPNLNEIVRPVQALLMAQGHDASGREIQKLASAVPHQHRRRRPGKTLVSERRRVKISDL